MPPLGSSASGLETNTGGTVAAARRIKRHGRYDVYMLECADGTYYTGSTNNLTNRLKLHNNGHGAKYLRGKLPVRVVYAKEYRHYRRAVQAERELKELTHKEKEKLVRSVSPLGFSA